MQCDVRGVEMGWGSAFGVGADLIKRTFSERHVRGFSTYLGTK